MPLSAEMITACENAVTQITKNCAALLYTTPYENTLFFYEFFIAVPEQCQSDMDFIQKLFATLHEFQVKNRIIPSDEVKATLQKFVLALKSSPVYPVVDEWFKKLQSQSVPFNIDLQVKQYIERYKIIISSYLSNIDIVSSSLESSLKTYTSRFAHVFNSTEKVVKLNDNPKILFMRRLYFELDLLIMHGQHLSFNNNLYKTYDIPSNAIKETVLTIISQILENLGNPASSGHFFNTLSLIKADIHSALNTGKTLALASPATKDQISNALSYQFNTEKKSIRALEPSHLSNSNNSNSSRIMHAITQESQTFGGEDQIIVITSVRQNINPKLHESYAAKKQQLEQSKQIAPLQSQDLDPLLIEQESITLNPAVNEVLLLHGTTIAASSHIFKEGFRKPEGLNYLKIVGSLGPGIYMSDNFVKSGTFSTCMICGYVNCNCKIYDSQKVERCVIINKVLLGNPYLTDQKMRSIPNECDSAIGISKHKHANSVFNSTEICVKLPEQILPLFEVKYFTYEDMFILSKWPSGVTEISALVALLNPANKSQNAPLIKKECERLLSHVPLMPIVKTKVVNLLDQINIEASQKHPEDPILRSESRISNNNNSSVF